MSEYYADSVKLSINNESNNLLLSINSKIGPELGLGLACAQPPATPSRHTVRATIPCLNHISIMRITAKLAAEWL